MARNGINPHMNDLIREMLLPNGLTVSFINLTRRYFGDFHQVKLEIQCKIPVLDSYLISLDRDVALPCPEVVYTRTEERMGVPSTDIGTVLDRLILNFIEHSLPYFSSAQFPEKAVRAELSKIKSTKARAPYL